MNDYLIATCAVITIIMFMFLAMMHEKDVKMDCIKLATNEHYNVDDIDKLCGVEK